MISHRLAGHICAAFRVSTIACAFFIMSIVLVIKVKEIFFRFLGVTLNARLKYVAWMLPEISKPLTMATAIAAIVFALAMFWTLRTIYPGRFQFRTILLPLPVVAMFFWICTSYRFPALVLGLIAAALYVRFLFRHTGFKYLMLLFLAVIVLAWIPIDISLQVYSGNPRLLPAIWGEISSRPHDAFIVGGCTREYRYPEWVLVW
jgi:hypothetical protein